MSEQPPQKETELKDSRQKGWLRLSSLLIHPSIPPSGLHLCGCLSSCSSCLIKPPFLRFPSPHAAVGSSALRHWRFLGHVHETYWSLLFQEHNLAEIHWTGCSVGINLEWTEHVVLCGSNALITGVIKWAKLDRPGFGVEYTRLWFFSILGWDSGWQFMAWDGIREGENVPPSYLGSDPLVRGKILAWWLIHHIVFGCWWAWHKAHGDGSDGARSGEWRSTSSIIPTSKWCW